jgi:hypothetical protein
MKMKSTVRGPMTRIEFLKAELSTIDRLNRLYWQTSDPDLYQKRAHLVREDRRGKLITELLELVQDEKLPTPH